MRKMTMPSNTTNPERMEKEYLEDVHVHLNQKSDKTLVNPAQYWKLSVHSG